MGNLLRSPISILSKIKSYRPDGNRMVHTVQTDGQLAGGKMIEMCTSVQSSNGSAAQVYRVAHLGNLLRTPISIGYKIKTCKPDGNRMLQTSKRQFLKLLFI